MGKLKIYIVCLFAMIAVSSTAQCTFRNTAFSSGEYLTYNLYYNWKYMGEGRYGFLVHSLLYL